MNKNKGVREVDQMTFGRLFQFDLAVRITSLFKANFCLG